MNHTASSRLGLTSIVVPCWNQVEFTRHCIRALLACTHSPWELIVVNNGSTDGTPDYFAGVQDAAPVPVTAIGNSTNLGFPAAINQGLAHARGEYLVLLNNDAVVTEGWLEQLAALTRVTVGAESSRLSDRASEARCSAESTAPSVRGLEALGGAESTARADRASEATGSADPTPRVPCEGLAVGSALPTPPRPPFQRGGEVAFARAGGVGVGLVGPMTNYAPPPQLVEQVPYRGLGEMHGFARRWREEHRGQWFTVPKLSGFCLLMKRQVYEAIGGLDERFGLGLLDDDDLALRARQAGFELAVAHDLFIHHFGSRTFAGNGIDTAKLLGDNKQRFAAKWGDLAPRGERVALRPWREPPPESSAVYTSAGPRDRTTARVPFRADIRPESPVENEPFSPVPLRTTSSGQPTVSLTMIVRDEQENLPRCLSSVAGLFDEIVIVDTGSTDRTRGIAQQFGARVFDFVWVDDFAAARNAALARATGDYAFWLDADDVLDPPERIKLERLIAGLGANELPAYVVKCSCDPAPNGDGGQTVVDHVRLFPIREDVRWSYRVHEQILPALRRADVPVKWTDITIRHTGYTDRALRTRKLDRDARVLHEELAERLDDRFVLFNLGAIAVERQDWRNALDYLRRSLAGSAPSDSITRKLYALIARAHQMLGEPKEAIAACVEGLAIDRDDAELIFREAIVRRHTGDRDGAERCWRRILTLKRPEQFSSVDQGIYGHLTRRNLAVIAKERGDDDGAAQLWRAVLAEFPEDREARAQLEV